MKKEASMKLNTLNQALEAELADIFDAEQQLVKKLPEVAKSVTSSSVREALEDHLEETRNQVGRLERIFEILGHRPSAETCEAMRGLLEETDEILACPGDKNVKDAVVIGGLQRVEHYEIAAYGTARAFAEQLELQDVVDLLQETLDEEFAADKKLTALAEGGMFRSGVNEDASHAQQPGL